MTESKVWAKLRNELCPIMIIERVENSVNRGMPDVYFSYEGFCGWIEIKCLELPKRSTTKVKVPFRTGQIDWHKRHWEHGANVYTLIHTDKGYFLVNASNELEEYKNEEALFFASEVAYGSISDIKSFFVKIKIFE